MLEMASAPAHHENCHVVEPRSRVLTSRHGPRYFTRVWGAHKGLPGDSVSSLQIQSLNPAQV